MAMELKSYQRAFLRSQAQLLDPVVYVGKEGLTEGVVNALDEALFHHELVKVGFHSHKDDTAALSRELEKKTASTLVTTVGFTAVFFRQDPKDPERIYKI